MASEWVRNLIAELNGARRSKTKEATDHDEFLEDAFDRCKRVLLMAEEAIQLLHSGVDDFSLSLTDSQRSSPSSFQITLQVRGQGSSRRADLVVSSTVTETELGDKSDDIGRTSETSEAVAVIGDNSDDVAGNAIE